MKIIKIDQKNPDQKVIKKAVDILRAGGLVVYPTDTAYGLGANALDENAIKKMYEVKGRDFSKPTHVVVRNWEMIEDLTYTNNLAKNLYHAFLPGPLTIILTKKPKIPNILTADLPTLGVRIPDSSITQSLSYLTTFPYTTPSANRSGEQTPYSVDEVKNALDINKVDLIIDAGELSKTLPSTIIEISNKNITILREGPISTDQIKEVLNINIENKT